MDVARRLEALREEMKGAGLHAYFVPSVDPHQSEYLPARFERRQWLSGFSGSAGDVVVTLDHAGLWTDGRYHIQAARQLEGSPIELFRQGRPGVPNLFEWVEETLARDEILGADSRVVSPAVGRRLEEAVARAGARFRLSDGNLVDRIWKGQPPLPDGPVHSHPLRYAGRSVEEKLDRLRGEMEKRGVDAHPLCSLDDIAWLFNIRARDLPHTPVAISYALVTAKRALLFCDPQRLSDDAREALSPSVEVLPYDETGAELRRLGRERQKVWLDEGRANMWMVRKLRGCEALRQASPVTAMKAKKNRVEIRGAHAAHRRDGVAMVRFLRWLEEAVPRGGESELSAARTLHEMRKRSRLFRGDSFDTISSYAEHGAIVHYRVSPESDLPLEPSGLYLIDSGGQYLDGTTDITRTVLLGTRASREQKERFTRVLKGHMGVALCRFPAGTTGRQLDTLGRLSLWEAGLDYAHGTGHGVGSYLGVHESPPGISATRSDPLALEAGHILSDEPGYYEEGRYGIRIENLILVAEDRELSRNGAPFLRFDVLTRCPIDTRLIEPRLLSERELRWVNDYHRWVRTELTPRLAGAERRWLRRATRRLTR